MKSKVQNTIFIALALFAIYLTIFYSKRYTYAFETYSIIYEYLIHAIIFILPTLLLYTIFLKIFNKKIQRLLGSEKQRTFRETQIKTNLQTQISNYESELERIHEKYVNLSNEADSIMIQFNDIVETLINSKIESLENTDSRKEKVAQQMFYDLAHPIRVKLTNLKTITANAIESLRSTENKNISVHKELHTLIENSKVEIEKHELAFSEKDNLINSLKNLDHQHVRQINTLREKLQSIESKNKILEEKLTKSKLTDNELLKEIDNLQKENSELLKSMDQIKPFRKKYKK